MTNAFERAILAVSPGWAERRARSRGWVAYYEAAQPSRNRAGRREAASGNTAVARGGRALRELARHLEQNHDLARGVLDVLVRNTVGTGISVEPQPRMMGRRAPINDDLAWEISKLWRDFSKRPEVTWQHDLGSAERLMARTWFRDGEVFAQRLSGSVTALDHGTRVPYSIELIEPDLVPFDHTRLPSPGVTAITMGVETNAWNRPVVYYVYKRHPGEMYQLVTTADLKRVPADAMIHLKSIDRIGQLRGVTVFASVVQRLEDLKDYEESERVAAKVAASMAAMIIKGEGQQYEPPAPGADGARQMRFRPGMVFDDLRPGERVETIDTQRPNPNALAWRQGQLRAVAAGTGTSYSSTAKSYDGTYSSQRQELVEQWGAYQILAGEFISRVTMPMYRDFIRAAIAARVLTVPEGVDPESLMDAEFVAPQMPWIDPKKEVEAWSTLEDRAYASGPEIVRRRGGNPHDVLDQQASWLRAKAAAGVNPAPAAKSAPAPAGPDDGGEQGDEQDDDQAPAGNRRAQAAERRIVALERRHEQEEDVTRSEFAAVLAAVAGKSAGDTHVAVHLPQGLELSIPAPVVNVAAPIVNMPRAEAPVVNVEVAAPTVNVAAPSVTVQAPSVTVETPAPGPTETTIQERDAQGRANRFVTRPID